VDGLQNNFGQQINSLVFWITELTGLAPNRVLDGRSVGADRPKNEAYTLFYVVHNDDAGQIGVKRISNGDGTVAVWRYRPKQLGIDLHFYSPDHKPVSHSDQPQDAGYYARRFSAGVKTEKGKTALAESEPLSGRCGGLALQDLAGPINQDFREEQSSGWVRHQYLDLTLSYTEVTLETLPEINEVRMTGTGAGAAPNTTIAVNAN